MNDTKNDRKDDRKEFLHEITERQAFIAFLISLNDRITIEEMTEKIGISEKSVRRDLAALHEMGILFREGGRKNGYWVIKK